MQRIGSVLGSQVLLLLFIGSYAWMNPISDGDDFDSTRRLVYYGASPRRLQLLDDGRRPFGGDQGSNEDFSDRAPASSVADFYNQLEKRAQGNMYTFGLGKRSRSYGFGLGKRLEQAWKNSVSPLNPSYRQERRSKIYSFGLGKRGNPSYSDSVQEDYEEPNQGPEKKSRQFSFGLGKREVGAITSHNPNPIP